MNISSFRSDAYSSVNDEVSILIDINRRCVLPTYNLLFVGLSFATIISTLHILRHLSFPHDLPFNKKRKRKERKGKKKRNSPQNSLTLNLHISPQRQLLHGHTCSRGLHIVPIRLVDLVHRGEMLHVGEEDVDFEDGVEAGAGGGEDGGEVADALVLWGLGGLV